MFWGDRLAEMIALLIVIIVIMLIVIICQDSHYDGGVRAGRPDDVRAGPFAICGDDPVVRIG